MSVVNDRRILFAIGCMIALFLIALFSNVLRIVQQEDEMRKLRHDMNYMSKQAPQVVTTQDVKTLEELAALSNRVVLLTKQNRELKETLYSKIDRLFSVMVSNQTSMELKSTLEEVRGALDRQKQLEKIVPALVPAVAPASATNAVPGA